MDAPRMLRGHRSVLVTLAFSMAFAAMASTSARAGLQFQFDYRYDSRGFFNDPSRRAALEAAGRMVNRYVDELDAIVPNPPTNTWASFFTPPDESPSILLQNLEVPKDTMQIFAGGAKIAGRLAQAIDTAPVGFGSPEWQSTVSYRGQVGAATKPATDFGPMGGTMTFNDDPTEFTWHFDLSTVGLEPKEFDFITVAAHELLHLLGVGISRSWNDQVNESRQFTGIHATAVGSPTNPTLETDPGEAHWRSGTKSTWNGNVQEALLAPGIFPGRRALPTLLDRAALVDLGWEEASPGDATRDRLFNSSDLLAVFQAGLYETSKLASWSEGDWDDDGIFNSGDLIKALQAGTYENVPAAISTDNVNRTITDTANDTIFGPLSISYDLTTGDVRIRSEGNVIAALEITSQSNQLNPLPALAMGPFDVQRDDKWFVFDTNGFSDLDLPSLFPKHLSLAALQADIAIEGAWQSGGALREVKWEMVPEPSSFLLSLAGILGVGAAMRRR